MSDLVDDDISLSSHSEIDTIGDLIIDQMSISVISDYIDKKCHVITSEPWLGELQFPCVVNGGALTTTDILQFVDSKLYKQTKKGT